MPRRLPHQPRHEQHVASPEFTKLLFFAMGIAVLVGLLCGVIWVAYHLVRNWLS